MLRHKVKAGLTGWAQVNGWRGNTSIEKRIEYDLYYIENWSLTLDFKILWLTITNGLGHEHSYRNSALRNSAVWLLAPAFPVSLSNQAFSAIDDTTQGLTAATKPLTPRLSQGFHIHHPRHSSFPVYWGEHNEFPLGALFYHEMPP